MQQLPSSISTRLHYQHKSLIELIDGLSDFQVRQHSNTGQWNIFENIVHITLFQNVIAERLQQILTTEQPQLARYVVEADPLFHEKCSQTTPEIIKELLGARKSLTLSVEKIPADQLGCTGLHPEYGEMNIVQWLNFFLLYEAKLLFDIFKLASKVKMTDSVSAVS